SVSTFKWTNKDMKYASTSYSYRTQRQILVTTPFMAARSKPLKKANLSGLGGDSAIGNPKTVDKQITIRTVRK
ncbi:11933_t:CDS:1, partial [Ambispora gerdemannii]